MGEFLADIKKKFGEEDKELVKVVELKRLEQESKTMEEFIQEFRRATRDNRYKRRPLMEVECQPSSIKQWYDSMIALNRN